MIQGKKVVVAARSDKAKILADALGEAEFISLKNIPDGTDRQSVLAVPCFIYGGLEYKLAVEKLRLRYPNASFLPPLISSEDDYFRIKGLIADDESDIFCIHKSSAADIYDDALWTVGETADGIIRYAHKRGLTQLKLNMLMIGSVYHYKNDVCGVLIPALESAGISCEIGLKSVFDSPAVIDLYKKRTAQYTKNNIKSFSMPSKNNRIDIRKAL